MRTRHPMRLCALLGISALGAQCPPGTRRTSRLNALLRIRCRWRHGLVSLELAQVGPPDADWGATYSAALAAVARGWAA
jgi:hypothetical protein